MLAETFLLKAIKYCGNKQKALADLIGEHPDKISYWLNRAKRIPFHCAIAIEKATQGTVSRYDLAPYAGCKKSNQRNKMIEKNIIELTVSEKVEIGLSHEKSLGNRKGSRNDLLQNINFLQDQHRTMCTQVKGKTTDLAAKQAGFNSRNTYLRAKKVITHGIAALIEAMDKQEISIATAAAIAELTHEEQRKLLEKNKDEMLAIIRSKKKKKTSAVVITKMLKSQKLEEAEQRYQLPLRLVLLSLIIQSDAKGYFCWQLGQLKNNYFCYAQLELDKALNTLEKLGWIEKIKRNNQVFGQLIQIADEG